MKWKEVLWNQALYLWNLIFLQVDNVRIELNSQTTVQEPLGVGKPTHTHALQNWVQVGRLGGSVG